VSAASADGVGWSSGALSFDDTASLTRPAGHSRLAAWPGSLHLVGFDGWSGTARSSPARFALLRDNTDRPPDQLGSNPRGTAPEDFPLGRRGLTADSGGEVPSPAVVERRQLGEPRGLPIGPPCAIESTRGYLSDAMTARTAISPGRRVALRVRPRRASRGGKMEVPRPARR
jgi:hypothetical protein